MRPDETCVTGERVPGRRRPPCSYHYVKGRRHGCGLFDLVKDAAPQKTPRDLIAEGVVSRDILFTAFVHCVKLVVTNPEAECNRCGECCKKWSGSFPLHPDKPHRPEFDNPCTKLIDNGDGTYSCEEYGEIPNCPDRLPDGTDYDFFLQFLDGRTMGQIRKLLHCPACVYEFGRAA